MPNNNGLDCSDELIPFNPSVPTEPDGVVNNPAYRSIFTQLGGLIITQKNILWCHFVLYRRSSMGTYAIAGLFADNAAYRGLIHQRWFPDHHLLFFPEHDRSRKDLETLDLIQTKDEDEIFIIRCEKLGLTKRGIEICKLVRDGRVYKEIGETLFISERTVNKHMQNIFKKAKSNNKFDLLNKITRGARSAWKVTHVVVFSSS